MLSARARETSQQRMGLAACVVSGLILAVLATSVSAAPGSLKHPQTVASTPSANDKRAVIQLEAGKILEETLGGGEKHSYEIQADAGQFLHVSVEHRGIEVASILYDPAGKQIASMQSPTGAFGLDQVSIIADLKGAYRLEIAPTDKSARAGSYQPFHQPAAFAHRNRPRAYFRGAQLCRSCGSEKPGQRRFAAAGGPEV